MPLRTSVFSFLIFLCCCCSEKAAVKSADNINSQQNAIVVSSEKINGVSFVAPIHKMDASAYNPVVNLNANWVCLMPFGYSDFKEDKFHYNIDWQWWGEREEGLADCIKMAHEKGLKVMVKPQAWIKNGEFTGTFNLETAEEWANWEAGYQNFILDFAKVSDSLNAEIFCIGTELENFIKKRPEFWKQLIPQVKAIFSGKLTYAANWDEFKRTPFWDELDYIGVDAYFPLSDEKTPTVESLERGWQKHLKVLSDASAKHQKPIIFTEYGYRSMDFNAKEPWNSSGGTTLNFEAQNNAYQALFNQCWDNDWFAGGFIWKWFQEHEKAGGLEDNRFTPQNKPVSDIIRDKFKN